MNMDKLKFAILVDGENASPSDYRHILQEVEKSGAIAIKWVYADWTLAHQSGWKKILHDTASSPKQQFHYGKDAADHALVMDAIELISKNSRINAICIVSSDGGFYSLAQRVREHGLHVMAIGQDKTPEHFRKACHNFVYIKNLSTSDNTVKLPNDLESLLIDAYSRCAENHEPVYLGDMGTMLKTLDSSFDHRSHGASSLKKLIINKNEIFEIVGKQVDRCFIRLIAPQSTDDIEYIHGKIRKWNAADKYGFIASSQGDYHFNKDAFKFSEKNIKAGLSIKFKGEKLSSTAKGKLPSALDVVL